MIELKVYSQDGRETDTISVDEALLGGEVRPALLRQALLMYEANDRVGLAATKSRGMVRGSTRKLYRQKGTGNARMGSRRQPVRVGGGTAHGPKPRSYRQSLPVKARRRALMSALLGKMQDGEVLVLEDLDLSEAKTRTVAGVLDRLGVEGRFLLVTAEHEPLVVRCTRNIAGAGVSEVRCLNARSVVVPRKVILLRAAVDRLLETLRTWQAGQEAVESAAD
jgi:large subunit ribosomal protein L4